MESLGLYIYEIKKGTKPVSLVTLDVQNLDGAKEKINKAGLHFFVQNCEKTTVLGQKVNLFFGKKNFIDVIKILIKKSLNDLSLEEDFILGTLLGYSCEIQCERFLERLSCAKF